MGYSDRVNIVLDLVPMDQEKLLEKKLCKCIDCGIEHEKDKRASSDSRCNSCKKINNSRVCSFCGSLRPDGCKRKDICRKHIFIEDLVKYFGFDKTKLGSLPAYEEYERISNLVREEYIDHKKSLNQIGEDFNIPWSKVKNIANMFKSLGLKNEIRSLQEGVVNAIYTGRLSINTKSNLYKHGYHTTWDNKLMFYRSSYELNYAKKLDEQRVEYTFEKLRILYWDSTLLKQRVAIPDFYIPFENKIVEIKSEYTYDEQNMKDKRKAYIEHGYQFELRIDLDK